MAYVFDAEAPVEDHFNAPLRRAEVFAGKRPPNRENRLFDTRLDREMFLYWAEVPLTVWLQMTALFVAVIGWVAGFAAAPGRHH